VFPPDIQPVTLAVIDCIQRIGAVMPNQKSNLVGQQEISRYELASVIMHKSDKINIVGSGSCVFTVKHPSGRILL